MRRQRDMRSTDEDIEEVLKRPVCEARTNQNLMNKMTSRARHRMVAAAIEKAGTAQAETQHQTTLAKRFSGGDFGTILKLRTQMVLEVVEQAI